MQNYISFSGGVESTAMCLLYGGGNSKAIFCDTGAEHLELYKRIDLIEEKIKKIHSNFEIIRIRPNVKIKGQFVNNLIDAVILSKFMPSPGRRYCTGKFKIEPIDNFLSSAGNCSLMIGLNADEQTRPGNWGLKSNIEYLYPLQNEGLTRADCEELLKIHNLHPNFPAYMLRGGCSMCFFKSEKEYKALYYMNRPEFEKMLKFENEYQDNRTKVYSIMSSGKTLKQLARECESELFKNEILEIYKDYKKEKKSCGVFCHR